MRKLFFAASLALLCITAPRAWAALDVHDDIKIDQVTTGANNVAGTNISFPNGGGPFWVTLYEDDRAVGALEGQQHDGTWVGNNTTLIDTFYTFSAQTSVSFSPGTRYDIEKMQIRTLQAAKVLSGYGAWVFDTFNRKAAAGIINPRLDTPANNNMLGVYQAAIWMGIVGWTDANLDGIFQTSETMQAVGGPTAELFDDRENYALGSGIDLSSLATEGIRYSDFLADTWWAPSSDNTEFAMLRTWNGIHLMNVQAFDGGDAADQMIAYRGAQGDAGVQVVPEPASLVVWSVLAGGAAGFAVGRKRRKKTPHGHWSSENREAILAIIDSKARLS